MSKMNTWLLRVGGAWNAFFTLFHALSAYGIQTAPGLDPAVRALLQMLNTGVILMLAYAAFVSFARGRELLTTSVGRATTVLVALFYGVRAAEEVLLSPSFSPVIFAVCLLVATIYTALTLRVGETALRRSPSCSVEPRGRRTTASCPDIATRSSLGSAGSRRAIG